MAARLPAGVAFGHAGTTHSDHLEVAVPVDEIGLRVKSALPLGSLLQQVFPRNTAVLVGIEAVDDFTGVVLCDRFTSFVIDNAVGGAPDKPSVERKTRHRGHVAFCGAVSKVDTLDIAPLSNDVAVFQYDARRAAAVFELAEFSRPPRSVAAHVSASDVDRPLDFVIECELDCRIECALVHTEPHGGRALPCGAGECNGRGR